MEKKRNKKFWIGTPPWIIIGSVIILVPIFLFWTIATIQRQKEGTTHLLLEKGAALIRSFEAGTRTGMMGMMGRGRFQLQRLLTETAQQPDIVYIMVTDADGTIRAHSDPEKLGMIHGKGLNVKSKELRWRLISNPEGADIFEVFRIFSPIRSEFRMRRRGMMTDSGFPRHMYPEASEPNKERIIFIGLDTGPIEMARKEEARHIVIMATILLLIGFGAIFTLFLVHAYRTASSSLTRIKAFSDSVVENMPIGLVALDADKRIASFNQTAESVLQVSSTQMIGRPVGDLLPPQIHALFDELNPAKKAIDKEINCLFKDGRSIPLDISISLLESEEESLLGYIVLFRDLSEVQSLKREINRSQRLASIGMLAAGVAHEIRNPLSSIKGFATYFRDRYRDIPKDKKSAEIMIQEVERLNRVVGQLLEFARPVDIQKKPSDIQELVRHSLKLIEKDAEEKKINISVDIPSDLEEISIDTDRTNQVLLNLYLNAIEAMDYGGSLTVRVSHDDKSQILSLSVTDTGHGMAKEDLVHVFDPYYTTKSTGTGLGLAIVHKIVESHNGEVRVESELNKGTTVTILLPFE